ncbi:hypothetical protein HNR44_002730 [Geomicrobium halophilum]|uniref:DUF1850 domain-containing protein n=1 Tax=Geomicrobium halophilum TaxID=549000 RepID=A0A841PPP4_9BACL|nr:DUF1850 domain-containing protein [Geomicrobium halophilum]MBB6450740.1 hypothetical protein [Geomicrobium halophilum]
MRKRSYASFIVILAVVCLWYFFSTSYHLTLYSPRDGTVFAEYDITPGDELELSWIHSVEHTPWTEKLIVTTDEQFKLTETKFQSYGAGVPSHDEGVTTIENDHIIISDIDQLHDTYNWIHSHEAKFSLTINGEMKMKPEDLPHHTHVEMIIQ